MKKLLVKLTKECLHLTLFGIPACVVYKDVCSSGVGYTGETTHIVKIRWNEHENKID